MANIFEKLGLIEKADTHPDINDFLEKNPEYFPTEESTEIDTNGIVSTDSDRAEALEQVNKALSEVNPDWQTTIDKVEELRSNLPDTLPLETARSTVQAMLNSFQIDAENLVKDSSDRIEAINLVKINETRTCSENITVWENAIEDYKYKIQDYEQKIQQTKAYAAAVNAVCAEKVEHYVGLGEFLSPGCFAGSDNTEEN